ncbi:MAG: hypothetical protein ABIP75_05685 [Pyrinomonadaceae bacterium]
MRFAIMIISVAMALSFFKCGNGAGTPTANSFTPGVYEYTGFDTSGKKVISGRLELKEIKDRSLKGTWQLTKVGSDDIKLGPQVGTGEFVGSYEEKRVDLNLNPFMADNNVFIAGQMENGELKGSWSYSGFAGPITKGTFVAKRK